MRALAFARTHKKKLAYNIIGRRGTIRRYIMKESNLNNTNLKGEINVLANGTATISSDVAKNRRKFIDVILLAFIVLFVGVMLMFFAIAQPENEAGSVADLLDDSKVLSSEEGIMMSNDAMGNKTVYTGDETEFKSETDKYFFDTFINGVTLIEQGEGDSLKVTYEDGSTVTTLGSEGQGIKSNFKEIDLDKCYGTAPINEEQAVDNAINAKVAEAKKEYTSSNVTVNTYGTQYTTSTVSKGCSDSGGDDYQSVSEALCGFYISGGTWYRVWVAGHMDFRLYNQGSGNNSTSCGVSTGSSSISSGKTSGTYYDASTSYRYFMFYAKSTDGAYDCDGSSCSCTAQGYAIFYAGTRPSVTGTWSHTSTWATSKSVSITLNHAHGFNSSSGYYYNSPTATTTTNISGGTTSTSMTKTGTAAGYFTVTATSYTQTSGTFSKSASALYIDNETPNKPTMGFYSNSGGTTAISSTGNYSNVYIKVSYSDVDTTNYPGAASGIKQVVIKNSSNGATYSANVDTSGTTTGSHVFTVPGTNANGSWTATITDKVNKTATSSTNPFSRYDGVAPTISGFTYGFDDVEMENGSVKWSSSPIKVTFTVTDDTNSTASGRFNATVTGETFTFVSCGTTYVYKLNSGITRTGPTYPDNDTIRYSYTMYLPYDAQSLTATNSNTFVLTVKDGANNSKASTAVGSLSNFRIDTVAPAVTTSSYVVGNANKHVNTDVQITIVAQDYAATATNGYYYNTTSGIAQKYNNGSGLKYLYVYKDAGYTQPQDFYVDGVKYSGVYGYDSDGKLKTSAVSKTITIKEDTSFLGANNLLYFVVEDWCGNKSNGSGNQGSNYAYNYAYNTYTPNGGSATTGTKFPGVNTHNTSKAKGSYYLYDATSTSKNRAVLRDTYTPQILVYGTPKGSTQEILLASTNGYNNTYNGYTFDLASVDSQSFRVVTYHGASGGNLYVSKLIEAQNTVDTSTAKHTASAFVNYTSPKLTPGTKAFVSGTNFATTPYATYGTVAGTTTTCKSTSKSFTFEEEGTVTYGVMFVSGSGTKSQLVYIRTQMDQAGPTVRILGFSQSNINDSSTFKKYENGTLTNSYNESELTNGTWYNANKGTGLYGIFEITDNGTAGIANKTTASSKIKSFGKTNVTCTGSSGSYTYEYLLKENKTQNTTEYNATYSGGNVSTVSSKYGGFTYSFKYKNGSTTYTYNVIDDGTKNMYASEFIDENGNIRYIVTVKMFNRQDMADNCPGFKDSVTGRFDIKMGTYLTYSFIARDFLGNTGICSSNNCATIGGTGLGDGKILRYYVDPFSVSMDVNYYSLPDSKYDSVIASKSISGLQTIDVFGSSVDGVDWTTNHILAQVKKHNSLSTTTMDWWINDMSSVNASNFTTLNKFTEQNADTYKNKGERYEIDGEEEWIIFNRGESKKVQLCVVLANMPMKSGQESPASVLEGEDTGGSAEYVFIKQDTAKPILGKVYFSTEKNIILGSDKILLSMTAEHNNGNYTFVLDQENTKAFKAGQYFVWSRKKVYVYLVATDVVGNLSGSGISTVTIGGYTCEKVSGSSNLYCTMGAYFGYDTKDADTAYNIKLKDAIGNEATIGYGGTAYNGTSLDRFKAFPVVDSVDGYVKLIGADNDYLHDENSEEDDNTTADDIFAKDDQNYGFFKLKGIAIKNSLTINIGYTFGISDAKVYLRERPYGQSIDNTTYTALKHMKIGNVLPNGYVLANEGWGNYSGTQFVAGTPALSLTGASGTGNLEVNLKSLKARMDVLIVTGTGTYYLVELGDVFIDSEPVIIDSNMTIFAVQSNSEGLEEETYGEIPFDEIQTLWSHVVGDYYTNGNVYIYYQISDTASGVDDDTVLYNDTTVLEKIVVKDLPKYTINGITANVINYNNVAPVVTNESGYFVINGAKTSIAYTSSYTTGTTYQDVVYYRLLIENSSEEVVITATDIANNNVQKSNEYTICIDKEPVELTATSKVDGKEYVGSTTKYTNKAVEMIWTATFGDSGFGYIEYELMDNFANLVDYSTSAVPSVTYNGEYAVLKYLDAYSIDQTYYTNVEKGNSVKIQIIDGKWAINGNKLPINADTAKVYKDFANTSWEWKSTTEATGEKVVLTDSYATGVTKNIYTALNIPYFTVNGNKVFMYYRDYANVEQVIDVTNIVGTANTVTLKAKVVEEVYKWHIGDADTGISVSNYYPTNVQTAVWTISNLSTLSDCIVSVIDNYSANFVELRIPKITYNASNKLVMHYYNANGELLTKEVTSISKPTDNSGYVTITTKKQGSNYYWAINNTNTNVLVSSYYASEITDTTWDVYANENKVICKFTIQEANQSVTYRIKAYNAIETAYAVSSYQQDLSIDYVEDTKTTVSDVALGYKATWEVEYTDEKGVSYVEYVLEDSTKNVFAKANIEIAPKITFDGDNNIIFTYLDTNNKEQSYNTGVKGVSIVSIDTVTTSGVTYWKVNDANTKIIVDTTVYKNATSIKWTYNFDLGTLYLEDKVANGLASKIYNAIGLNTLIGAQTSGELKVVKENGSYYWYLSGNNTNVIASKEDYGMVWTFTSGKYSVKDNIDYASARIHVPQITQTSLESASFSYINSNGQIATYDNIAWNDGVIKISTATKDNILYWHVNDVLTNIKVSDYYNKIMNGIVFEYNVNTTTTVKITFNTVKPSDTVDYRLIAYNKDKTEDSDGKIIPASNVVDKIVSIDTRKPIIDVSTGNIAELQVEDVWHALAKSLRISVYDELSGIGDYDKIDTATGDWLEYVILSFKVNETPYNIPLKQCEDGLYRAYNYNATGDYYELAGLAYVTEMVEYTLTVRDRAGNEEVLTFTPNIDTTNASISNLVVKEYDEDGNELNTYTQEASNVQWVNDTATSMTKVINWTSKYIRITMDVSYGGSGYLLQWSTAYVENRLGNSWETLDPSLYTVEEGTNKDTITIEIAKDADYLYSYYKFRAITKAQDTELNVYKSYTNPNNSRGNMTIKDGKEVIGIELEAYEKIDKDKEIDYSEIGAMEASCLIAIDRAKPTIEVSATSNKTNYGYAQTEKNWKIENWTNTSVNMNVGLTSQSDFISGNAFFYKTYALTDSGEYAYTSETMILPDGKIYVNNSGTWNFQSYSSNVTFNTATRYYTNNGIADTNVTISTYASMLDYLLTNNTNNTVYEFYTQTGSGIKSDTATVGVIDGEKVYGIKIDTNVPTVAAYGRATYDYYTGNDVDIQETLKDGYDGLTDEKYSYTVTSSATYTYYNTVLVRLSIGSVGYSGIQIIVEENGTPTVFDTITYKQFKEAGGSSIYRYMHFDDNGETIKKIYIKSIADSRSGDCSVNIRIDNTTPIVYVENIDGVKATNWGWNSDDGNLHTNSKEYWYVSSTAVNLGIGVVENVAKNLTNRNDEFRDRTPYSGYRLYYRINGADEWTAIEGDVLSLSGIGDKVIDGNVYEFKIVSGAGLSYQIGCEVINNQEEETYDKQGQEINEDITAIANVTPLVSHVINRDVVGSEYVDYNYNKSQYELYVDANDYGYVYNGRVYLGQDAGYDIYDNNTVNFVSYDTSISDENGNYTSTTETGFHRGDKVEFIYNAKYNGVASGANYNYFHNKTNVISGVYNDTFHSGVSVSKFYEGGELNGKFYVQFVNNNVQIVADFIAEVEVTYGQDVFYKQDNEDVKQTTGTATYRYNDGTIPKQVSVKLAYQYYQYNSNDLGNKVVSVAVTPNEVGAYYVYTQVSANSGNFRVTEQTKYKDFVIKYFNETDTGIYDVNDATDFAYVDNDYYLLLSDGNIDTTTYSYLNHNYQLNADITVQEGSNGEYTGTFNGNNYVITLDVGTITSSFGLFGEIEGAVNNLNVRANGDVVINVDANENVNVGLLAQTLTGTVSNVSVLADVTLNKFATSTGIANFGGLVAQTNNLANVGSGDNSVFTDVRITNNGNEVANANVSGLIGYVNEGTIFNNVYVFGEIEIYGITENTVNVGAVYGNATSTTYSGIIVNYFDNNVFYNDATVSGMSNSTTTVTINGVASSNYAEMISYDEITVGGGLIVDYILNRLYQDFGYQYYNEVTVDDVTTIETNTAYGVGTEDAPLVISTLDHVKAINGYMNANFVVGSGVTSIDMSNYDASVAIHKVFNGSFTTESGAYVQLTGFANNMNSYDNEYFGLFGQLNGKVSNIVFNGIDSNINYTADVAYVGIVAGKAYENAIINNVMFIGAQNVTSDAKVYVGVVAGSVDEGRIYDVFSINNVAVNANNVILGGIVGYANAVNLINTESTGAIYLLGRVEGNGNSVVVGSAVGSGTVSTTSNVYSILNNAYSSGAVLESRPIGSSNEAYGISVVDFEDNDMRSTAFGNGANAFGTVFGTYYPLSGNGTTNSPFEVYDEEDFNYINLALYATYTIKSDISFTDFTSIGKGLIFSGTIKGSGGDNIQAEESSIASLSGLDEPLVYYNKGSITDLSININCNVTVNSEEEYVFGAIAVYSSGTIKNVTVSGTVSITSNSNDTTLYVSGFVGKSYGGTIDTSKIQNSISALNITVNGGGTAYVGGYAGVIEQGNGVFSYGIATGTMNVTNVQTVYAGLLVGAVMAESTIDGPWKLDVQTVSIDYTYTITVDGEEIAKRDEEGNPLIENFYGITFIANV